MKLSSIRLVIYADVEAETLTRIVLQLLMSSVEALAVEMVLLLL
jgi:hypothetical protein